MVRVGLHRHPHFKGGGRPRQRELAIKAYSSALATAIVGAQGRYKKTAFYSTMSSPGKSSLKCFETLLSRYVRGVASCVTLPLTMRCIRLTT
jgi:hypothetical protein